MTDKEIIEMAEKAGLVDWSNSLQRYWIDAHEPGNELMQFAREVAAHEREACAKLLENGRFLHDEAPAAILAKEAAKAIRARSEA